MQKQTQPKQANIYVPFEKADRGKGFLSTYILLKFYQLFDISLDGLILGNESNHPRLKHAVYKSPTPELLTSCDKTEAVY